MLGWFSWFRENGAPTFYGDNRTPVIIDTQIVLLFALFVVPSLAFLLILPGARRYKTSSAITFLFHMFVGATTLVSLYHPCWHRAEARILTSYRAFSAELIEAKLMVRVGLQYLNISLKGCDTTNSLPSISNDETTPLAYNERFSFSEVHFMEKELHRALKRGLPFPILKVIEYLSADGFAWGRQYRLAGYYTACMLKTAIFTWCISMIFVAFLPHMVSRCIFVTGILIGIGDLIFYLSLPSMPMRFPTKHTNSALPLHFNPSICFHATVLAALLCILFGSLLWLAEHKSFYELETLFSARRGKAGSVLDTRRKLSAREYAEQQSQQSLESYDTKFTISTNSRTCSSEN